jgi:hypothetical protein
MELGLVGILRNEFRTQGTRPDQLVGLLFNGNRLYQLGSACMKGLMAFIFELRKTSP